MHTPFRAALSIGLVVAGAFSMRTADAAEVSVSIQNFTFAPARITVPAGTTVVWINNDDIPHVVADAKNPRAMKSPPLDTGDRFTFVYTKPGTYPYFCALHPHMQGTVIVR